MNKVFSFDCGEGVYGKCFWFRVFGYGLHFKKNNARLLFSEGYEPSRYSVFFGIRVRLLRP